MEQEPGNEVSRENLESVHQNAISVLSVLYSALTEEGKEVHLSPVMFNGTRVTGVHYVEGEEAYLLALMVTPDMHDMVTLVEAPKVGGDDEGETQNNDHS